jgi:hypothetical protein
MLTVLKCVYYKSFIAAIAIPYLMSFVLVCVRSGQVKTVAPIKN